MNLHQAPAAVALSALACAVVAVLFRESSVAVVFVCAAAVLIVVSAAFGMARFPADRVRRCEVCRQRLAGDEYEGLCSVACAAEYREVLDRQEEEDHWWRAIA